jgi:hypothetical protein
MVGGLAVGAVAISFSMSWLFKRFYTASFSVIFGIFLSMIPNMLNESCVLGRNPESVVSVAVLILGIAISWYLGDLPNKKRNRGSAGLREILWKIYAQHLRECPQPGALNRISHSTLHGAPIRASAPCNAGQDIFGKRPMKNGLPLLQYQTNCIADIKGTQQPPIETKIRKPIGGDNVIF